MGQPIYQGTIYGTPNGVTTVSISNVAEWSTAKRLGKVFEFTGDMVGPEVRETLESLVTPEALAIMAGVLVAWIASHAFGVGEIIDIVLFVAGVVAIGWSVLDGIDHLYNFAKGVCTAKTMADLHTAAVELSKAIAILGLQIVLAVLFKGVAKSKMPKTYKGGPIDIGEPPTSGGFIYKPTTRYVDPSELAPGVLGSTDPFGNIRISNVLVGKEKWATLFHEKVHQFLTPKLAFLRKFRLRNRTSSYVRSSLSRYLEEALSQTLAEMRVYGLEGLPK